MEMKVPFGTAEPIPFREHGCEEEFLARVRGSAEVSALPAGFGEGTDAESALKKMIAALVPDCFARWPEGKLIMGSGNREILGGLLEAALAAKGVTAKVEIRGVDLVEGQMDAYMNACGEALRESVSPSVRTDGLTDEAHGPLIGFSYGRFSHSMTMGGSSSSGDELNWNRDGSIILTSSFSGGGNDTRLEYRVKPECAEKVRAFVAEKHLAALSKQKIPTPAAFDNFTSSSFRMTFDDSALGGSAFEMLHIDCGPAGMTFRKLEDEAWELLKECRETGECIVREEKEIGGAFGGMTGFPGMMGGGMGADIGMGAAWTCGKCGRAGNTGRFCPECGNPR
ncbi:MAG: hypothetical protein E7422_00080 [Ruminococcaceae bacterium]|nr:hypothetical protein [Oscillospiraceae bacterium]